MSSDERAALRRELIASRETFVAGPAAEAARDRLARGLDEVLRQLEPDCLGSYWPIRGEFTPSTDVFVPRGLALPYARRDPRGMHYRVWDGDKPRAVDECGIAASDGAEVVPDVVLVPCVGYTDAGARLGYGGGYFDAWLAAHPGVTSVGIAWSIARLDAARFEPHAADRVLTLIVTDTGVVG